MDEDYNTKTVRVKWKIGIGFVGATREGTWDLDPGELPNDPSEREKLLDEMLEDEISNYMDAYYEIED